MNAADGRERVGIMKDQRDKKPPAGPNVICFGEILWDCLPRGLFLGGAPFNVAFHLKQLGDDPVMWSALGCDFLGQEVRRRMEVFGLSDEAVSGVARPTGAVVVSLGKSGDAAYQILEKVAWDEIPPWGGPGAAGIPLVHGSLALRGEANRNLLQQFCQEHAPRRFFDVNLRPPYDDLRMVRPWMEGAFILKMNEEELSVLAGGSDASLRGRMGRLLTETGAGGVVVTRGAAGAAVLVEGGYFDAEGVPVAVKDTVGAGDAFMAQLVHGWIAGQGRPDWEMLLAEAVKLGSWVASCDGAQPSHASRTAQP